MSNSNELYFGTVYCPYAKSGDVPEEFWERDVITMKQMGMNIIRPFVAWDRIEREEGVYDFSKLDLIFDLAAKHGMKILLNLGGTLTQWGGMYPPRYLVRNPKVHEQVRHPGDPKQFGPVRELCMEDPIYLERAKIFLDKTVERYTNHPALGAWSLWNEPFYHGDGCFCEVSMKQFRDFLREKYNNDINALNAKWGTECPVDYQDFDEAEPGVNVSFSGGGYGSCMDLLKFNRQRVYGWLKVVRDAIEKNNPRNLKIGVNVAVTATYERSKQHNYPSTFDQNYIADVPGYSAYTFNAQMGLEAYLFASSNVWCRSSGKDPMEGFWAVEGEGGQISYFPDGKQVRGEQGWRSACSWLLAANGAKMLMYWKFGGRITDVQTDQYNIFGFDGSVTERAETLAKTGVSFLNLREALSNTCVHAKAAILIAPDTEIARICDDSYSDYILAIQGAYRIMNELHIECDFVDERLFKLKKGRYNVLIAPETIFLNETFANEIKQFVADGGTLITDYRFAQKREDSMQFPTIPGHNFQEASGCFINDATFPEADETLILKNGETFPIRGIDPDKNRAWDAIDSLFHAHLHLTGAESLGEYSNGSCALAKNRWGKGFVYTFGFSPFIVFRKAKSTKGLETVKNLIRAACEENGVASDLKICGDDTFRLQTGVLCKNDDPNGEKICFLINFAEEEIKCQVDLPGSADQTEELLSGTIFNGKKLDLTFAPYETKIFRCC